MLQAETPMFQTARRFLFELPAKLSDWIIRSIPASTQRVWAFIILCRSINAL